MIGKREKQNKKPFGIYYKANRQLSNAYINMAKKNMGQKLSQESESDEEWVCKQPIKLWVYI